MIWGGFAAVALLALATPPLGLRLGQPPIDAPYDLPAVQTQFQIQHAFPRAPAPAVVVTGPDVAGPKVAAAVSALRARTSSAARLPPSPSAPARRWWWTCSWPGTASHDNIQTVHDITL